jgi:hypothetical protein
VFGKRLARSFRNSLLGILAVHKDVHTILPFLPWMRRYGRRYLKADLVAGLTNVMAAPLAAVLVVAVDMINAVDIRHAVRVIRSGRPSGAGVCSNFFYSNGNHAAIRS